MELERHLLSLVSARLTPELEQRRQQLDQAARQARDVLAEEMNDGRRLEKAAKALASAREAKGGERAALLAVAQDELEAIPPRSFSAPEAKRLRGQLEQLEQDALVTEPAQPEESPESESVEAPAAQPEPPPPPPPPPAEPQAPGRASPSPSPPPGQSDNGAADRQQPLF
jgi:hypothetical protein